VIIPSSVTSIGGYAFSGCISLASVTISTGVVSIGYDAFRGCTSLVSVTIPSSVASIEGYAFSGAKGFIQCAAASKPSGWSSYWDSGYTGQVIWSSSGSVVVHTVTFNPNDGTVTSTTTPKLHDTEIGDLPMPTRTGYTFTGWFTAATGGTQISATTQVTADVTYYAHWAANQPPAPAPITQHAGGDRFDTAAKASQKAYPDPAKVDAVILSFASNFPDALAASYLAGVVDAPILLSPTTSLHPTTLIEINRLRPKTIYITGSETVVGQQVDKRLKVCPFNQQSNALQVLFALKQLWP
jgi:uncharacterized repeat protein (TIGR02543 family)